MPFESRWYVENRVMIVRNYGEFTLAEMHATNQIFLEHIHTGKPPVHLLIDTREMTKMPGTFVPMLKEIEAFCDEPNMGWTIMVANNSVMRFFGTLSSNFIKMPFRAVKTYEEANAVLARVDPSLVNVLPALKETEPTPP